LSPRARFILEVVLFLAVLAAAWILVITTARGEVSSVHLATVDRLRTPDAAEPKPTLADFEHALAYAKRGAIVSDTGMGREVQDALLEVALAAPHPPKPLVDAAADAFLRQAAEPRAWWQQSTWLGP
jgi:hypothetical protein